MWSSRSAVSGSMTPRRLQSIWYSTLPGTASAVRFSSGLFVNQPLTFNPGGATSHNIVIPTLVEPGNPAGESAETFSVGLQSTQTGSPFTTGSATILANGVTPPPTFSISNAGNVTEGNNAVFTVNMSGSISAPVTIWYSTVSGTGHRRQPGTTPARSSISRSHSIQAGRPRSRL